jgi:hypothetical protein
MASTAEGGQSHFVFDPIRSFRDILAPEAKRGPVAAPSVLLLFYEILLRLSLRVLQSRPWCFAAKDTAHRGTQDVPNGIAVRI